MITITVAEVQVADEAVEVVGMNAQQLRGLGEVAARLAKCRRD